MARSSILCPVAAEWRSGKRRRNQSARRAAYSWTLVCQLAARGRWRWRDSHAPRMPNIAGTSDVDEVGTKTIEYINDKRNMAQKRGIEAQIFFESEGEEAAWELEGPGGAVFDDGLGAGPKGRPGAHAKEWQIATAREGFKVAAGVGDPVDFVKRVWEIGDTWNESGHVGSEPAS